MRAGAKSGATLSAARNACAASSRSPACSRPRPATKFAASGAWASGPLALSVGHGPAFDRSIASRTVAVSGRAASRSISGVTKPGSRTVDVAKRGFANDSVPARAWPPAPDAADGTPEAAGAGPPAAVGAGPAAADADTVNVRLSEPPPLPIFALSV